MPRYRIVREIPEEISFWNGKLFFQDYYAGGKDWVWYVRRESIQQDSLKICIAEGADKLELMQKNGFTVRKDSREADLLESLVRRSLAERLPD